MLFYNSSPHISLINVDTVESDPQNPYITP